MNRRRFLEIAGASSALIAGWLAGLKDGIGQTGRSVQNSLSSWQAAGAQTRLVAFSLSELLTRNPLQLGALRSCRFYVSLDDIARKGFLQHVSRDRNCLIISSYTSGRRDSALRRAVLAQLRTISPDDYRKVNSRLTDESSLKPGDVISFQLSIPRAYRKRFPVDALVAVIFEAGQWGSRNEDFDWVSSAFEIAEQKNTSNLIIPCLGRNWRDRHTVEFATFYESLIARVPSSGKPARVYFSLYSQWPSFELESAVAALNRARNKVSA